MGCLSLDGARDGLANLLMKWRSILSYSDGENYRHPAARPAAHMVKETAASLAAWKRSNLPALRNINDVI